MNEGEDEEGRRRNRRNEMEKVLSVFSVAESTLPLSGGAKTPHPSAFLIIASNK